MAINYSTNWLKGSYANDALHFIGWFENPVLMAKGGNLAAHFERTSIAIGLGYDLIQNRGRAQSDLAPLGVNITPAQITLLNQAYAAGTTPAGLSFRNTLATQLAAGGVVLPNRTAAETLFQNFRINVKEGELDKDEGDVGSETTYRKPSIREPDPVFPFG